MLKCMTCASILSVVAITMNTLTLNLNPVMVLGRADTDFGFAKAQRNVLIMETHARRFYYIEGS